MILPFSALISNYLSMYSSLIEVIESWISLMVLPIVFLPDVLELELAALEVSDDSVLRLGFDSCSGCWRSDCWVLTDASAVDCEESEVWDWSAELTLSLNESAVWACSAGLALSLKENICNL